MSLFVTFEGPEGSGKTTLCTKLKGLLINEGYDVVLVREPGGTEIGDQVRRVLLDQDNTSMYPEAEFLLFSASRAQLIREIIIPRLKSGAVVLCDRFLDSSLAYQGYGHQIDVDVLRNISQFVTDEIEPDLTVLLDIPPRDGLNRRKQDPNTWNRLDAYSVAFHERVRVGFLRLAEQSKRWKMVDARQSEEDIFDEVSNILLEKLKAQTTKR